VRSVGAGGRYDTLEVLIKTSDREAEGIYVTGNDMAVRRGASVMRYAPQRVRL